MLLERVALLGPASPADVAHLLTGAHAARAAAIPGYRGVPTTDLAQALVEQGVQVDVVTTAREVNEPTVLEGTRLRLLIAPQRTRARDRAKDLFAWERAAMEELLRSSDAPVLHAMWTYEFAWTAHADRRPAVVTAHDAPLTVLRQMRDSYRAVRTAMAYVARARTRHLTAVSPYLAERWRREMLYRGAITVIPNMVSAGFRERSYRPGMSLIDISDAGRVKNVPALLEAFQLLRAEGREVTLDLVGPGLGKADELARRARGRQVEGIRFRGILDRAAVRAALEASSVLVHPSREESFSLSIAEAMSAGVPVVAGRRAGAVAWVLGDTGLLVDVECPDEIADAVRRLLDDPHLAAALAERARHRAVARFSPEVVATAYLGVYGQALQNSLRRAA
jgi:glycosyltransferase involved in cell wall biosynthesis